MPKSKNVFELVLDIHNILVDTSSVVYFDKLLGAACTQKLVKIHILE